MWSLSVEEDDMNFPEVLFQTLEDKFFFQMACGSGREKI